MLGRVGGGPAKGGDGLGAPFRRCRFARGARYAAQAEVSSPQVRAPSGERRGIAHQFLQELARTFEVRSSLGRLIQLSANHAALHVRNGQGRPIRGYALELGRKRLPLLDRDPHYRLALNAPLGDLRPATALIAALGGREMGTL